MLVLVLDPILCPVPSLQAFPDMQQTLLQARVLVRVELTNKCSRQK